jgi:hypothetical protein
MQWSVQRTYSWKPWNHLWFMLRQGPVDEAVRAHRRLRAGGGVAKPWARHGRGTAWPMGETEALIARFHLEGRARSTLEEAWLLDYLMADRG